MKLQPCKSIKRLRKLYRLAKTYNAKRPLKLALKMWLRGDDTVHPPEPMCDVCKKNRSVGVCCVPGVPISMSYCKECLEANAHPYDIIVANTACVGGYNESADWWKEMVDCTLKHLGKTREEFDRNVAEDIAAMEAYDRSSGSMGDV